MEKHYSRQEVIGRGNFGVVYKGQHIPSGKVVAIKVLNLDTINDDVEDVQREIALLALLSKKESNIIKYYESFLSGTKLWIIMDLCAGGSIRTLLKAGPLGDKHLSVVFREILVAISHMHHEGIIHRDIKAANVLITLEGNVRVCDFGVAADTDVNRTKRTTLVGTPYWMAPEVVIEGQEYNTKADIWSAGITLFEMATGNPPYSEQEAVRALLMISKGRPPRLEGPKYSSLLKDVVALCLDEDPTVRPTADDLLKHKFIKQHQRLSTFVLRELIDRYNQWQQRSNNRRDSLVGVEDDVENLSLDSESVWNFDIDESEGTVLEYMGDAPRSLGELFEGEGAEPPVSAPPPLGLVVPNQVPSGMASGQGSSVSSPLSTDLPRAPMPHLTASSHAASHGVSPVHSHSPAPPAVASALSPTQSAPVLSTQPLATASAVVASRRPSNIQTHQLPPSYSGTSTPTSQYTPIQQQHTSAAPTPNPASASTSLGSAYASRNGTSASLPPTDLNHPLRLNRTKSHRAAMPPTSQSTTAVNALQLSPGRDREAPRDPPRLRAHSYGHAPQSPGRSTAGSTLGSQTGSRPPPPLLAPSSKMPSRLGARMMSAPKLPGLGKLPSLQSPTGRRFPAVPPLDMDFLSDSTPRQAVAAQMSIVLESFGAGLKCLEARLAESS